MRGLPAWSADCKKHKKNGAERLRFLYGRCLQDQKAESGKNKAQNARAQTAQEDRLCDVAGNRSVIAFALKAQKMHELFARVCPSDVQRIAADETGAQKKHYAQRTFADARGKGKCFLAGGDFFAHSAKSGIQPA